MSLRFSLLALLSARPMTGYDIVRVFEDSVAYIWHASHTQIYPELRRMEADGQVAAEDVPRGPRGTKRMYSATPAGLDELTRMAEEVWQPARLRDAPRLKAAYLEQASPAAARAQLRAHLAFFEDWRARWLEHVEDLRAGRVALLADRLERAAREEHAAIVAYKVFAYEGMVARADMEIAWARRGLELVDELEAARRP